LELPLNTETLTEEEPALIERMTLDILLWFMFIWM
jgi:hypothetical protein